MATTNNITGDSLITKASTDNYRSNWDAIFKKDALFKKPDAVVIPEWPHVPETEELVSSQIHDTCFECLKSVHSMGCGSKSVHDAYITLRDSDKWKYFTDIMLKELDNKVKTEQTERKFNGMFDEEKEND